MELPFRGNADTQRRPGWLTPQGGVLQGSDLGLSLQPLGMKNNGCHLWSYLHAKHLTDIAITPNHLDEEDTMTPPLTDEDTKAQRG